MSVINKGELHSIFTKLKVNKHESIFYDLYGKYNNLVYKITFSILNNREESQEIKQVVFSRIWKMEQGNLPTKNEAMWLYTLTKNETLNHIKEQEDTINLDEIYYIRREDKELDDLINKNAYNKLISKLNHKEQEIVSLKILANLSFKEIAQILNEPVFIIKLKYYKSISSLKIFFSNLRMYIKHENRKA